MKHFASWILTLFWTAGTSVIAQTMDVSQPRAAERPPACVPPSPSPGASDLKPSTVTTIGQMYYCILDNYYSGPILDNRSLLVPAFAALTQELQRRGLDQPQATLPALTGKVDDDWAAFSEVCEQIFAKLPEDAVRQAVAEAALRGMAASLNDNHDLWQHGAGGDDLIGLRIAGVQGSGSFDAVVIGPMQRFARNPPKEQDAPDKDIVPISYGFRGSEALLVKRVCLWL